MQHVEICEGQIIKQSPFPIELSYEQLQQASDDFAKKYVPFPTEDNLIGAYGATQENRKEIAAFAKEARPVIHKNLLQLLEDFIFLKRTSGSDKEKGFYACMKPLELLDRLLKKRPLMFMNAGDDYLLRNGEEGRGGFEEIGTDREKAPLVLADYLSYDEMALSAMVNVSTPTYFINNGARDNAGIKGARGTYQEKGILVGLVGSRFEKPSFMEWAHIVISKEQNTPENGYGKQRNRTTQRAQLLELFAKFYGQGDQKDSYFPDYEEASLDQSGRYIPIGNGKFFNRDVYKKRMKMSVEPFLVEANEKARQKGKQAYVYAAATGLGVWLYHPVQKQLLLEVYIETVNSRKLESISDIQIPWFNESPVRLNPSPIAFHFLNSPLATPLKDQNKLLVASYAWDGNAFPGNEYWIGMLNASGDPAAASCSFIPELQNPYINPNVSGFNAFIVD